MNITGLSSFFNFFFIFGLLLWLTYFFVAIYQKTGHCRCCLHTSSTIPCWGSFNIFLTPTHHIGGRIISIYEDIYILQTLQQQSSATNLTQTTPGANQFAPGGLYHISLMIYSFFTYTLLLYQLCANLLKTASILHKIKAQEPIIGSGVCSWLCRNLSLAVKGLFFNDISLYFL